MKKILVLGATGRTGTIVVRNALAKGYEVRAFFRDPLKFDLVHNNLTVKVGDARNKDDLIDAMHGQDAVISTLGSTRVEDELKTRSSEAIVAAMRQTNVKRLIAMETFLAYPDLKYDWTLQFFSFFLKQTLADIRKGLENLTSADDLDWTILFPTRLRDGDKTDKYRLVNPDEEPLNLFNSTIRADVADYLLKIIDEPVTYKKSYLLTSF